MFSHSLDSLTVTAQTLHHPIQSVNTLLAYTGGTVASLSPSVSVERIRVVNLVSQSVIRPVIRGQVVKCSHRAVTQFQFRQCGPVSCCNTECCLCHTGWKGWRLIMNSFYMKLHRSCFFLRKISKSYT